MKLLSLALVVLCTGCNLIVTFESDGQEQCEADGDGDGDIDADSDVDSGCERHQDCDDSDPCTNDLCLGGVCDNPTPTDFGLVLSGSDEVVVDLDARGLDPSDISCVSDAVVLEHLNEDFESDWGDFEHSGSIELRDVAAAGGSSQGVRLCSDDSVLSVHVPLDDAGEGRVMASFWLQNVNVDHDKYLLAEYSLDDSTYRAFAFAGDEYYDDEWRLIQAILPPETGPNGEVWLQFRRIIGSSGGDCGDVDNVMVQSWLYAFSAPPLVHENFDSNLGVFTQVGEASDVTRTSSERDISVELVYNRDGAIMTSFTAPAPSATTRLAIRWAWRELADNGFNNGDYILAEYSEDGSNWSQMGAIGFDAASDFFEFGAVPPDDVLGSELWIRFIAPTRASNSSSEGALIDDVTVSVDDLTNLDDSFETFVDNDDGSYSSQVTPDMDGRRRITCRYQCGAYGAITNSIETTL